MPTRPENIARYLDALPPDRREAIAAVRQVIVDNLDPGFEEGVQYGMIGYYVPHSRFPAGYHCDPKQPLPMAHLGSQKSHMALYLMCLYTVDTADGREGNPELLDWFEASWKKTGKKLDMGKACLRFKKLDDLALDVIGETFRRVTAEAYVARYLASRANEEAKAKARKAARRAAAG